MSEKVEGQLKVLKTFSTTKHKQVIGGKVTSGLIEVGAQVKIMRRETAIGKGKITELQQQKLPSKKVDEGNECGMMVEADIEIVPGDVLEAYIMSEK
jgi:translation initiation factor IF-2